MPIRAWKSVRAQLDLEVHFTASTFHCSTTCSQVHMTCRWRESQQALLAQVATILLQSLKDPGEGCVSSGTQLPAWLPGWGLRSSLVVMQLSDRLCQRSAEQEHSQLNLSDCYTLLDPAGSFDDHAGPKSFMCATRGAEVKGVRYYPTLYLYSGALPDYNLLACHQGYASDAPLPDWNVV